jgi:hypothetical protein
MERAGGTYETEVIGGAARGIALALPFITYHLCHLAPKWKFISILFEIAHHSSLISTLESNRHPFVF